MAKRKASSGGFGRFLLGLVIGLVVAACGAVAYCKYGTPHGAVAVANKPLPFERSVTPRISDDHAKYEVRSAPFGISEDVFEGGAHVYIKQCAFCHGTPGHDVAFARSMNPAAPQLWKRHANGKVVGVSDDAAGETYSKVANGMHQSGMPAFQHLLSETQMWQVSLLLKNADQTLPDPVVGILAGSK